MDYQTLYESLAPVWRRKPSDWLIHLALRLKMLEEGKTDNKAAVIEIWHQAILLAREKLSILQTQQNSKISLFDQDYYAWVKEQIRLLHLQQFDQLDLEHLPDELNDLVWLIKREIETNLEIVCSHLLKYKYAREYLKDEPCCSSWFSALQDARQKITVELKESPSLQNYPLEELDFRYQVATGQVYRETNLSPNTLPQKCPWRLDQILNKNWLPD